MKPPPSEAELLQVWRFIRGEMRAPEFELWLVANADLRDVFGLEFYVELIAADYRNRRTLIEYQNQLERWARAAVPMPCECLAMVGARRPIGWYTWLDMQRTSVEVASRGEEFWWLRLYRCEVCNRWWLVAFEEVHESHLVHCLRDEEIAAFTEAGTWPNDFDDYATLVRLVQEAGFGHDYANPGDIYTLYWMVSVLAKARPGIRISEIAALLKVPPDVIKQEAQLAVQNLGAVIEFDVV